MDPRGALEETTATLFMQLALSVCTTNSSQPPYINKFGVLEREIPREVFIKYRNENMRKNFIDEISAVDQ